MQTGRFMDPEKLPKGLSCTHGLPVYTACPKCFEMEAAEAKSRVRGKTRPR